MADYITVKLTPLEIQHIIDSFDMCGTAELNPKYGTQIEDRINSELCGALKAYNEQNGNPANFVNEEDYEDLLEDECGTGDLDEDSTGE